MVPPTLVVHTDLGTRPAKQWMARAALEAGRYVLRASSRWAPGEPDDRRVRETEGRTLGCPL